MQYEIDLLDHIQIKLNRIHSSLFALQSNTDTIYEYLRVLASHILNPMVIPSRDNVLSITRCTNSNGS